MKLLLILDAFCGAGGAAAGYWQALGGNAVIVGVDIEPQKRYPFHFVRGDAVAFIRQFGYLFDFIHASPPCQMYTWSAKQWRESRGYVDLVAPTREALINTNVPFVIENVVGAPLVNPIRLCGTMFGLQVFRHRLFEASRPIYDVPKCVHGANKIGFGENDFVSVAGHGGAGSGRYERWCQAMGIDWMTKAELTQAIPPKMTQYIGAQMFRRMGYRVVMPGMNVPIQLNLFSGLQAAS